MERSSWLDGTNLATSGKDILIKSVAQVVLTYTMSCFKLPRGLCQHITPLIRNFWWGNKKGERKIVWVSWDSMTKPKYMGGLGFRDIDMFNLCMLAKHACRLLQEPESLRALIFKGKVLPWWFVLDNRSWQLTLFGGVFTKAGTLFVKAWSSELEMELLPALGKITGSLVITCSYEYVCSHWDLQILCWN